MEKFLCVIYDSVNNETIVEYEVEAEDWYYARHQAALLYRKESIFDPLKQWKVDSLNLS